MTFGVPQLARAKIKPKLRYKGLKILFIIFMCLFFIIGQYYD